MKPHAPDEPTHTQAGQDYHIPADTTAAHNGNAKAVWTNPNAEQGQFYADILTHRCLWKSLLTEMCHICRTEKTTTWKVTHKTTLTLDAWVSTQKHRARNIVHKHQSSAVTLIHSDSLHKNAEGKPTGVHTALQWGTRGIVQSPEGHIKVLSVLWRRKEKKQK